MASKRQLPVAGRSVAEVLGSERPRDDLRQGRGVDVHLGDGQHGADRDVRKPRLVVGDRDVEAVQAMPDDGVSASSDRLDDGRDRLERPFHGPVRLSGPAGHVGRDGPVEPRCRLGRLRGSWSGMLPVRRVDHAEDPSEPSRGPVGAGLAAIDGGMAACRVFIMRRAASASGTRARSASQPIGRSVTLS
jgi:hypothetical protein